MSPARRRRLPPRLAAAMLSTAAAACRPTSDPVPERNLAPPPVSVPAVLPNDLPQDAATVTAAAARQRMVRRQLEPPERGITNVRVLQVMAEVPRHEFVPGPLRDAAYEDHPLPIGHGQTISQPYIVAFMTQALDPRPDDRVLEIGTGSGYQAAVLARLVAEVRTIDIVEPLARQAEATLRRLGVTNVLVRAGNGHLGWPEAAPFDAVIVTCAPDRIPPALVDQLRDGGRMILPVESESGDQELILLRKAGDRIERTSVLPVRFVPMTGDPGPRPGARP